MEAVYYFKRWFRIPRWGASITEINIFGKRIFQYYSEKVPSGQDDNSWNRSLPFDYYEDRFRGWFRKNRDWRLCLVLKPVGDRDTIFKIGRCSEGEYPLFIKIAPIVRWVSDGLFAVRVGPDKSFFFLVADREIKLEMVDLIRRDNPNAEKGIYKDVKIY